MPSGLPSTNAQTWVVLAYFLLICILLQLYTLKQLATVSDKATSQGISRVLVHLLFDFDILGQISSFLDKLYILHNFQRFQKFWRIFGEFWRIFYIF